MIVLVDMLFDILATVLGVLIGFGLFNLTAMVVGSRLRLGMYEKPIDLTDATAEEIERLIDAMGEMTRVLRVMK